MLIKQGTSFWYLRDQCWRGLQQMFHCTRCSCMSGPSGCSSRQRSQRERVEQWVFWDLFLCSRSGRYTYHQTGDRVIAPRKSQWSECFPCFPTSCVSVNRRYLLLIQPALEGTLAVLSRLCNIWRVDSLNWAMIKSLLALLTMLTWVHELNKPGPLWANVSRFCGTDVDTIVLASNVRLSCIFPALWSSGHTLQGTWMSLMSKGCRSSFQHGEFGIVPAFHGDDIPYYFPGNSMYLNPRVVSILASHQRAIVDQTPRFNNSEFITNSSQSFLNLVITIISKRICHTLPQWPQWMEEDGVEMLFDRTEMGVPIFELNKTCERLQNRCEWVLVTFSLLDRMADRRRGC